MESFVIDKPTVGNKPTLTLVPPVAHIAPVIPIKEMPPLVEETPDQEFFRLLDRVISEHGAGHTAGATPGFTAPSIGSVIDVHVECIVANMLVLKGYTPEQAVYNFSSTLVACGWANPDNPHSTAHFRTVTAISMNDAGTSWGAIRTALRERFPVAA